MCVIAVSRPGAPQPTRDEIRRMFYRNPHGAGYMYARDGKVIIHKGFMDLQELELALVQERFNENDAVVYHFRISTQAGVNPKMTHPFPLTKVLSNCEKLDVIAPVGIAHNGIIALTSDPREKRYSDTTLFITGYMTKLIRGPKDVDDESVSEMIWMLTRSKWAVLRGDGLITTIGPFIHDKSGLLFSNGTYLP